MIRIIETDRLDLVDRDARTMVNCGHPTHKREHAMAFSISVPAAFDEALNLVTFPFLLASVYWLFLYYGGAPSHREVQHPWPYPDMHLFGWTVLVYGGYLGVLTLARFLLDNADGGWIWQALWFLMYTAGVGITSLSVFVFFAVPQIPQWVAGGVFLGGLRWMHATTRPLGKKKD
ncbi:hypothetical protein [Acidithiobacillus ferrooxidans]|uniref:hypothetical protein n=1 Tax=Acidithiobacillus ferrooxidans TaxID=920 RepID=UPI0013D7CCD8|nr:hypothetical protein [Acidithiobacillus ferrooxidans]